MTAITIKLNKDLDGDSTLAAAEIFDDTGELVRELDVAVGYDAPPTALELPSGLYLVRARLPSGQTVSQQMMVKDKPNNIVLDAHGSEHEWLSWHHFSSGEGQLGLGRVEEKSFLGSSRGISSDKLLPGSMSTPKAFLVVQALGHGFEYLPIKNLEENQFDIGSARVQVWTWQDYDHTLLRIEAASRTSPLEWRRAFVYAELEGLSQVAVLPIPWEPLPQSRPLPPRPIEVLLSHPAAVIGRSSGYGPASIIPSTVVRDPQFGAMIGFLGSGDIKTASRINSELEEVAKSWLYHKLVNPYAAAAGGYVLLASVLDFVTPEWDDWTGNLSDWFKWLPDGPIIRGSLLLRRGEVDKARESFLDASRRGVPFYTIGLRLLLRGLIATGRNDDRDLTQALQVVRPYAAAVDPTNPLCTFYGKGPASPSPPPSG